MDWTPDSWNTCPKCKNAIDADDVFDGSEVCCLGCRTVYVVAIAGDKAWLYEADDEPASEDDP